MEQPLMGTGSKIFSECRGSAGRDEPRQVGTEVLKGVCVWLPWLHRQPGIVSVLWEEGWAYLV